MISHWLNIQQGRSGKSNSSNANSANSANTTSTTINDQSSAQPPPAKKQHAIITTHLFPKRIPVSEIICFLQPLERLETASLLSKHWSFKELQTRQSFFHRLCCKDGGVPSAIFHSNVDYRQRYKSIEMKRYNFSAHANETKGKTELEILNKFNTEYTTTLIGTIEDAGQKVQIFRYPVTASFGKVTYGETTELTAKSLCFDLDIDSGEFPTVDTTKDTTIQIWIERNADHKMALFSSLKAVFDMWVGFHFDGTVVEHEDNDDFMPEEGFHGGFGFWQSSDQIDDHAWFTHENYEFGVDTFQFQFEPPTSLPDFSGIGEATLLETVNLMDTIYDSWRMAANKSLSLSRIKVVYEKCDVHERVDMYNPENFLPSDLLLLFANAQWI